MHPYIRIVLFSGGLCLGRGCLGECDGKRCLDRGRFGRFYLYAIEAEDLGLGSCWCQIRNRVTEDEADSNNYVRSLLDIPYQLDVLSIIGIGYKDQVRKPFDESHLQWEKIHIGKFSLPEENKEAEE